jgi:hypothetical protein
MVIRSNVSLVAAAVGLAPVHAANRHRCGVPCRLGILWFALSAGSAIACSSDDEGGETGGPTSGEVNDLSPSGGAAARSMGSTSPASSADERDSAADPGEGNASDERRFGNADEPGEGAVGTVNFPALGLTGATQDEIRESYCARYAEEVCAARAGCCVEMEDDCVGGTEIDCGLVTSRMLDEGNTFSSERVAAIFEVLAQAGGNCGRYQGPRDTDPFAIRFIPEGGECDVIEERFGNEQCEGPLNCIDSVCSTPTPTGGACSDFSDPVCQEGSYCGAGGICAPLEDEGGECGGSTGCIEGTGLVCASNPIGSELESVCTSPRADGEYCQLFDDCASGFCSSQVCTACSTDADCGDTPCTGGVCVGVFDSCDPFESYGR